MQRPPGSVFAGYRLEAVAGRGGMGIVYRATQLALSRTVALKLIAPGYAHDPGYRERFDRELRAVGSLDHPNVIPVYHAGEEDGQLYVAMRWVEGTDLESLIAREGPLEPARAARIVSDVASALDFAHASGLYHRDVKPANVLIARDGQDRVFLSDFGLSKHSTSAGGLTRTGQWVGTPDYVSPEQIRGMSLDPRGDVYSLGCVLFHALTGEVPFPVEGTVSKLWAHMTDPPPSARERVPVLPEALDEVLGRAMAKEPGDRYASAGELGRAALEAASAPRNGREPSTPSAEAGGSAHPTQLAAGVHAAEATELAAGVPAAEAEATEPASAPPGTGATAADAGATELGGAGVPSSGRPRRGIIATAAVAALALAVGVAVAAQQLVSEPPTTTSQAPGTDDAAPPEPSITRADVTRVLDVYRDSHASGDVTALRSVLTPGFRHSYAADTSRSRREELALIEDEATRGSRLSLRVRSITTAPTRAEARVRWRKRADRAYSLQVGTPIEEAGGLASEFRGLSRFFFRASEGREPVISRIDTTYDLRLPVCAPPSRCAQIPDASGSVAVTTTLDGEQALLTEPATFRIPRPEMRILYIPLNRRGRALGCDDFVRVSKRYELVQTGAFVIDSVFKWCP